MRAAVGLAEGFENDLELVRRDADAGVADLERTWSEPCGPTRRMTTAGFGELEGVGQQVGEDLLQPLPVGRDRVGRPASTSMVNSSRFSSAMGWNVRDRASTTLPRAIGSG